MLPSSDGRVVVGAIAAFITASREDSNGDETSTEANIKHHRDEGEEGDASEEKSEDDGESSVDDGDTRHALGCLLPFWYRRIVGASRDVCIFVNREYRGVGTVNKPAK